VLAKEPGQGKMLLERMLERVLVALL